MKRILSVLLTILLFATMTAGVAFAEAKDPYNDEVKIGFIPHSIAPPAAVAWAVGMEREFQNFPNISFQTFDGKSSAETEVSIMSDLINQEYDAIILQASDQSALAASVMEAEEAGIPVVTVNLDVAIPHAGLVSSLDYEAGALVAEQMAQELGGAGKVVIIQATPGNTRGELMDAGFREAIAAYPDIEILDAQTGEWVTEKATNVMNDFLTKYPQIDGVFAHNDAMAEGASAAAEAAGRLEKMVFWGINGETKALEYIEQGKMTGTIYTDCYAQGATAARLALMYIGSRGVIDTAKLSATPTIKMAPIVVTAENVASITEDMRW